ncbi:MAG: hypothetical protein Q9M31_07225 [Mariprofundus sp.]|nr:hypothetical protein [Mariprofundus sp.]
MNRVEAQVDFYFKGVRFTPSAIVNLDECMRYENPILYIFKILASENGIGSYSHEFDVMLMEEEEVNFNYPTGLAIDYVHNNRLDMDGFRRAWLKQCTMRVLQPIAKTYLGITELNDHPQLKAALIAAYESK